MPSWQPCTLTYYQPSAGGINGSVGGGACGVFIDDNTWGCAAPPQYPCGEHITFLINGKMWDVPVIDRGGAIQGSHFDLNYIVAKTTGFLSTGSGSAQFVTGSVPGAGTGSGSKPAGNSGGSIGPPGASSTALGQSVNSIGSTIGIAGIAIGVIALVIAIVAII